DEIDKADIEFPNDLLLELDAMRFSVDETGEEVVAVQRPFVLITSNNEKELPDAFLRRCIFHYIEFPDQELMTQIIRVHHPDLEAQLLDQCLEIFFGLRELPKLRKRPSTSELIDWILALKKSGVDLSPVGQGIPFIGALIKNEQDLGVIRQRGLA
ncbi:MAG: MoxR family ATPase, partial [Deltaproteobacteria bacterium]|nr:MoxR family ATPase [Deltaproteobacteria bacterium]